MEKLEETLEELLDDGYEEKLIKSIMFQIIFSLAYLQKHFDFTHNDLHINNVMYVNTDQKFLYYKYNNQYFKVPTHGKIAKIIDFGRAIFTIKNKVFFNDVFSKYGEAEGQYTHPIPNIHFNVDKKKDVVKHSPNYSFDLCRLATTMIEYIDEDHKDLYRLLNRMATDCNGENLNDCDDSFDLYIKIAHDANKAIPKDLIDNKYFKEYRVKKKAIFKNSVIYNMN
jgi:serine/threonine protein kinase